MKGMKILITNDDGLNSNGMLHLEEALGKISEVWAIAPDRERSATSMAISIRESLRIVRAGERRYTITGFPADCVNVALITRIFPEFDLVISGINHGVNLGDDIYYSGTVGAARHAALRGIPAIALSCPIREHDGDFHRASRWVCLWIEENFVKFRNDIVYNINYPLETFTDVQLPLPEVQFTHHGKRVYYDEYQEIERGENYSVIHLKDNPMGRVEEPGTDFAAVENGFISITPISVFATELNEKQKWKKSKVQIEKN